LRWISSATSSSALSNSPVAFCSIDAASPAKADPIALRIALPNTG